MDVNEAVQCVKCS